MKAANTVASLQKCEAVTAWGSAVCRRKLLNPVNSLLDLRRRTCVGMGTPGCA
ncbi:hypothetical protein KCP73_21475 [Salmonella enterica subsp. enterica]|nr:hypothetical protein KCP73_21475 [Salmonella enterica subsp. enterica]